MQGRQASDEIQESNIARNDKIKGKGEKEKKRKKGVKKKRMQVPDEGEEEKGGRCSWTEQSVR